jgi:HD-GYP domain-containing protein (c-di-GMP phosphodiesterase class II)
MLKERVKTCFIYLMNTIQAARIYSEDHPTFKEFLKRLFDQIQDILQEKKELTLGIVGGELAWEDEIFFGLTQKLRPLITFLEESLIERIVFQQGLRFEELNQFFVFLARTKKLDRIDEKEYFHLHGIQNIRAGRLRAPVKVDGEGSAGDELRKRYVNSLQVVAHDLNMVLNEEEIEYLDLRFNILAIMEDFVGRHQDLLNLVSVKERDLLTFVHLLNVSLLSMFFGSKLEFVKNDVLDLGIAALYHDVGKLSISLGIIKKKTKLTETEFIQMRDHPLWGARILDGYKETLGVLPQVVAFEHHLRYDLTGYPKLAHPQRPHPASMIVAICDVYDALALKRSYKKDYPPDKIYEVMIMEKGRMFEPLLLEKFFQFMGVWPVGTIVSLSDGRIAVVRQANEQDIFRPTVEVISAENGGETIDLAKNKEVRIIRALNPLSDGEKYVSSVYPTSPDS